MKKILALVSLASIYAITTQGQTKIQVEDAYKHMGETVTICDKIYGFELLDNKTKTAIQVGSAVPKHKLSILLTYEALQKLTDKGKSGLINKSVCVTGKVINYKGEPEIVINKPEEIFIVKEGGGSFDFKPNDFMNFE